jgi:CRISPR-associated protein Csh2
VKNVILQNSEFLFGFEAVMTNPNGDPDQENRPRMDYETATTLVSDARRKRDCRDILKRRGYAIFVDTFEDNKIPMDRMFEIIVEKWLANEIKIEQLFKETSDLEKKWNQATDKEKLKKIFNDDKRKQYSKCEGYCDKYFFILKDSKAKKTKEFVDFNNLFLTEIIKNSLIDIRLFGSAMAVEGVSRTYTGPVQITWGYSLHPVELVKSNTITSIMNEGNSTFGKKHKLHYGLIAHYGTINKYAAILTGMKEWDREIFRKALVQGMMSNQTDSKQGQTPLFYIEVQHKKGFDGYLGDLRRFCNVTWREDNPIRSLQDLTVDFGPLARVIEDMKNKEYVEKIIGWLHPLSDLSSLQNLPVFDETIDLWAPIPVVKKD